MKIIKIFVSAICIIFLFIFLAYGINKIVKVNKKYPPPDVTAVNISEDLFINQNKLKVRADDFNIQDISYLTDTTYSSQSYMGKTMVASVNIRVDNVSDEKVRFDLPSVELTSDGWHNGLFLDLFLELNPKYNGEIEPKNYIEVIVPYIMYENHFKKSAWQNLDNQDYRLVFQLYPEKKYISLHC
jgi:hypothetical protein